MLTLNVPPANEALTLPLTIWIKLNPVTPDAGILYNPAPSPTYEPLIVPEPVMLPVTTKPLLSYVKPL